MYCDCKVILTKLCNSHQNTLDGYIALQVRGKIYF